MVTEGEGGRKFRDRGARKSPVAPALLSPDDLASGFEAGGRALWAAMTEARSLDAGCLVLLVEACRIKDRLDRFERLIGGDSETWCQVRHFDSGEPSTLIVSNAITEARMHAGQLRQLIDSISRADPTTAEREGTVDDPLAAARAARQARLGEAGAAGS